MVLVPSGLSTVISYRVYVYIYLKDKRTSFPPVLLLGYHNNKLIIQTNDGANLADSAAAMARLASFREVL